MVMIVKNIAISGNLIARLKMIASGMLSAAVPIMKARAVPNGNHFSNSTNVIGTTATQFTYNGTPIKVVRGTVNMPPFSIRLIIAS